MVQDNDPNLLSGFIANDSDRDEDVTGVFVSMAGVLKQIPLSSSFYSTVNALSLANKKANLVTALEAV